MAQPYRHLLDSEIEMGGQLRSLGVEFDAITPGTAFLAGQIFRRYRQEGGPRERLLPDFIVAAHASSQASALAAIDRGYFRSYFPQLRILQPLT